MMSDDPYEKDLVEDSPPPPPPPPPLIRRPRTTSVNVCPVCSLDHPGKCDDY